MRGSKTFWTGTCAAGGLVAAFPAVICIDSLRELHRLSGIGSHPAWLGSMFSLVVAACAAGACVVLFAATVGVAVFGRWIVRRLARSS